MTVTWFDPFLGSTFALLLVLLLLLLVDFERLCFIEQ